MMNVITPASPDHAIPFEWRLGCIWKCAVGVPVPPGQPRPADHPPAITVHCLIDSGTSHTFATPALFQRLGLQPTGEKFTVFGAQEARDHDNFKVDLVFPCTDGEMVVLRNMSVSEGALSFGPDRPYYDVVVGLDVLRFLRLTIDGPRQRFTLEKATEVSS